MPAAPTNAEIMRLLESISKELAEVRKRQDELLRKVAR
jgi:hypothetical protein